MTDTNYDHYVGKTIRIIELDDPYDKYSGKVGTVLKVAKDPWDDVYFQGTWGGINVYPEVDKFEVVEF